jgi:hypothetical protein
MFGRRGGKLSGWPAFGLKASIRLGGEKQALSHR